jgi:hypothetical protein
MIKQQSAHADQGFSAHYAGLGTLLCHRDQAIQFDTYLAMEGRGDASAVFLNRKTKQYGTQ